MDESDDCTEISVPSFRWTWLAPVILSASLASRMADGVSEFFGDVAVAVAGHTNWLAEQKDFEMQTSRDIERIVNSADYCPEAGKLE